MDKMRNIKYTTINVSIKTHDKLEKLKYKYKVKSFEALLLKLISKK